MLQEFSDREACDSNQKCEAS